MAIVLGPNRYGKAENRVVRIYRDSPRHEIRDLNVSTALRGRFDAAHLEGDQSAVLPTDSQKQTVYAYAQRSGWEAIGEAESAALTRWLESSRFLFDTNVASPLPPVMNEKAQS